MTTTVTPQPAVPVNAAPARWYKRPLARTAGLILAAGVLGAIAAATFSGHGSPASQPGVRAASAPASQAPVSPAPASTPAITVWWTSTGQADVAAVTADLSSLQADADAQDLAALMNDGSSLETDANTAAASPPPVPSIAAPYTAGMTDYADAGSDLAAGDLTAATSAILAGTTSISQATAAIPAG